MVKGIGHWQAHIDYRCFPQTGPVKAVDEVFEIAYIGRVSDPRVVIVEVPLILRVSRNLLVKREIGPEREVEWGMCVVGIAWPFLVRLSHRPGRWSHDSTRPVDLVMEVGIRGEKGGCCGMSDALGDGLDEESARHGHPHHAL